MSATTPCVPCCSSTTQTVNVPGTAGAASYTTTTANFIIPAEDATVAVSVADSSMLVANENVFVGGANFIVSAINGATSITLQYIAWTGDTAAGQTVVSGSIVAAGPGRINPPIAIAMGGTGAATASAAMIALTRDSFSGISAITDSSGGASANTVASGVGISTLIFHTNLVTLANGDILTEYVPGYKFKLLSFDVRVNQAATTAAKLATLNLEVNTTNVTGGSIALTSANCTPAGAAVAGSAITAGNTGSSSDSISIEASAVTAFVEGSIWMIIRIQNMDVADAFSTLITRLNAARTGMI